MKRLISVVISGILALVPLGIVKAQNFVPPYVRINPHPDHPGCGKTNELCSSRLDPQIKPNPSNPGAGKGNDLCSVRHDLPIKPNPDHPDDGKGNELCFSRCDPQIKPYPFHPGGKGNGLCSTGEQPTPQVASPAPGLHASTGKGLVALVVAENLASELSADLDQYIIDLEARGWVVVQSTYPTDGTIEDLKDHFISLQPSGLVGAVLVGGLPCAWFQIDNDFNANGIFDPPNDYYEEFPCDLYLCDLDGDWADDSSHTGDKYYPMHTGPDGIYDSHFGNRNAEIWVSRIDASRLTQGDEVEYYHAYFSRIHAYREGQLTFPDKGLFFCDDWWQEDFTDHGMELICEEVEEVREPAFSSSANYRQKVGAEGLYLTNVVHSFHYAHLYVDPVLSMPNFDTFFNYELYEVTPRWAFYNMFGCLTHRWTENDCLGALYLFRGQGLASVGSSKEGSMQDFKVFNTPLGEGKSWGEAFVELNHYWISHYPDEGMDLYSRGWFMGITLFGDATLDLGDQQPAAVAEYTRSESCQLSLTTLTSTSAEISFSLERAEPVTISIYNASGRCVQDLYAGKLEAGLHNLHWNAGEVPQGIYFVNIKTPAWSISGKTMVVR